MPSLANFTFFNIVLLLVMNTVAAPISSTNGNLVLLDNYQCNQTCGGLQVPFPFHITNSSCEWSSESLFGSFKLSCFNSTTLFLDLNTQSYRVLEFYPDGVLVDFPGRHSTVCRPYDDLSSFGFAANDFFGISSDNVVGLYDCEDSSLCEADCEAIDLPSCNIANDHDHVKAPAPDPDPAPACCYPLSDHSIWHLGDEFSVFSEFGCRGFSCWAVPKGMNVGSRGVKLEWALPFNSSKGACSANAHIINATTVRHGIRCTCYNSFVGDGFSRGIGCLQSCIKDGQQAYGEDCEAETHIKMNKTSILAGVVASVFAMAASLLLAFVCLLKIMCWKRSGHQKHQNTHFHSHRTSLSSLLPEPGSGRSQLLSLHELHQATDGFAERRKLLETSSGCAYWGILESSGVPIAVHKLQYYCKKKEIGDILQVLSRVELLSSVLHRHMTRIIGCCIDDSAGYGGGPMVVYEFPVDGSTLEEHLHQNKAQTNYISLDWCKRLSIAAQTASVLAFLQHEVSPPIFHHDLKSECIFLDKNYSVKLACFGFGLGFGLLPVPHSQGAAASSTTDVYDFGVVLLEIISGSKHLAMDPIALEKLGGGGGDVVVLQELVDPVLCYSSMNSTESEQIEIAADIARRCVFGIGGREIGMDEVAQELVHIITSKEKSIHEQQQQVTILDLEEETFSNSSLLQMISLSPDSIYVP
ncbi:hypothetical protein Dimus_006718 [Dionaea muscipula]